MITLERVAARRRPLALTNLSLEWAAGIHAVVGGIADGGPLLLSLIAGTDRPRAGRIRVLGGEPTDAEVRRQIALVPLQPPLLEALRVSEFLEIATAIRGEPPGNPVERLRTLGVEALSDRRVSTLSREEARAVAVVEAVTSSRVRVLLLEEPLVAMEPRAAARLPEVLRARSRAGTAIVLGTASMRDAWELAEDLTLLIEGTTVLQAPSVDATAVSPQRSARIRILTSDARALAGALANDEEVEAIVRREGWVTARGRNSWEIARAAGRAILASGVEVTEICMEPPTIEEARAAAHAQPPTAEGQPA